MQYQLLTVLITVSVQTYYFLSPYTADMKRYSIMDQLKNILLSEFGELINTWRELKSRRIELENEIDVKVVAYFVSNQQLPNKASIEQLEVLKHEEYQARNEIDLFIAGLY